MLFEVSYVVHEITVVNLYQLNNSQCPVKCRLQNVDAEWSQS